MEDVVTKVRHFTSADEFIAALVPSAEEWRNERWAFRGVGDASLELVPNVLRQREGERPRWWRPELELIRARTVGTTDTDENIAFRRMKGESGLVLQFLNIADHVGLPLPEDRAQWRSWRGLATLIGAPPAAVFAGEGSLEPAKRWPPHELTSLVGLAQHYGVPTRLLDWTLKPRVASYFAARDVMRNERQRTGSLAVWALHVGFVELFWIRREDPDVEVVGAPYASNANLAAQAGLFTVARHVHENAGLQKVIEERCEAAKLPADRVIQKLTLPASQARSLMARLAYEDVSAATVFPGYGGVVEALAEQEWWIGAS